MKKQSQGKRKKLTISEEIREKVVEIVDDFNREEINNSQCHYITRYKGSFLYLDRICEDNEEPICRLKYTGEFDNWEFAIFKFSKEKYDAEEIFFPGFECIDGSIQGAMRAGMRAYPISERNAIGLLSKLGQLGKKLFIR